MNDEMPTTWVHTFWGVLDTYISPSKQQWIRLSIGNWDWFMNGKQGTGETIYDCLRQMARHGILEGEFES